jgi:glycosyltransferase involved in cell wall biosynthesis
VSDSRIPILYLAPWIDYGGSDTNTLDWFRWIDRSRFSVSLITTQTSSNRRLSEVVPFADEVWPLPELMKGNDFAQFIAEFIASRRIQLVHVMNSRIAFDMMPDFRTLEHSPKIVVQLHVEEPSRDGYVRYVTTRYGNLVDAFSVSSASVGESVVEYGIPRERVVVIPTGIDTEQFSPERVSPVPALAHDTVHLLFIARLVAQKDPLLMVEVARELDNRDLSFCIHIIGGGELEPDVRAQLAAHGLQDRVVFEPPTHELRPWYAGADVLLMTSLFEGVPVIVYEALAMELPVVAPALAGIVELMGDRGGALVERRDRASDYADALEPLLRSRDLRRRLGREGRELVVQRYSVQDMASHHVQLYERLLAEEMPHAREVRYAVPHGPRFASRPSRGSPRVSVVTPCFNHGRPLRECVDSIRAQTYPDVELIVVDDGSTDADTEDYLGELDSDDAVQVVRMRRNQGPSAARNRGVRQATGRYVLPVDADNLLLPDAIERLVAQLQGAGEHVGFIYQNCQYFGNREDYFEPPDYNPWLLTRQNYIDTCALIDRDVFDLGFAYAEDIVFGHEDWDFFLQLVEGGIHGEPGRGKTLLYRKEGFTRSDLVEWTGSPFHIELAGRHPNLFARNASNGSGLDGDARAAPPDLSMSMKARWAPALSLIALTPFDLGSPAWETVSARLDAQRFGDFELLLVADRDLDPRGDSPPIRRLPGRLADRPAECLVHALEMSRGRHVMVTTGALPDLLGDPGSIERVVRLLEREGRPTAFCFADVGDARTHPFAVAHGDDLDVEPHSIAFSRSDDSGQDLPARLDTGDPVGSLARWTQLKRYHVEWRHLRTVWGGRASARGAFYEAALVPAGPRSVRSERKLRLAEKPDFGGSAALVSRLTGTSTWLPAFTAPLLRNQRLGFEEWTATSITAPPDGFKPEHYLGLVHMRSLQGTRRIVRDSEQGYVAVTLGGEPTGDALDESLGYVDEVAFWGLEPLLVCRHARTGAPLLVCGEDDPLHDSVEWPPLAVLGYIERFPVNPREVPTTPPTRAWLRGLIRVVDPVERRHRFGLGSMPSGQHPWELGALVDRDPGDGIATWMDADCRLHTNSYAPTRHPYDVAQTLRWVGAPASWRGFGRARARTRAVARRSLEAARHALVRPGISAPARHLGEPLAWLLPDPGPDRHPLFSAIHPVTADQLVTRDPSEPRELGYGAPQMLGYALALAPVTGTLQRPTLSVPWASRFGEALTRSEDPYPY